MLRRTVWRLGAGKTVTSGFTARGNKKTEFNKVDEDMMGDYLKMQEGWTRNMLEAHERHIKSLEELPVAEQVRRLMVLRKRFDVNMVQEAGLDVEEEYIRYNKALRSMQRRSMGGFWGWVIVTLMCMGIVIGGQFFFFH